MFSSLKAIAVSIWNTPWYVRLYFVAVVVPNLMITTAIFFIYFIPWHHSSVEAHILTYRDRRDRQIAQILERQSTQNQNINDNILRLERHQTIFMTELLRRQPATVSQ